MTVFGYYGHAAAGIVIGAALLAHGYFYQNERSKRPSASCRLLFWLSWSAINSNGQIRLAATVDLFSPGARVRPSAWPPCSLLAFLSRVRSFLAWEFLDRHFPSGLAGPLPLATVARRCRLIGLVVGSQSN